jgi:hypothetical protein
MERRIGYICTVLLVIGGTLCQAQQLATVRKATEADTTSSRNDANSQFFCNTGYRPRDCSKQIAVLRARLQHFYSGELHGWTWILVSSEDWRPILLRVGKDPDSPAFSILEKRQTFLEEALFSPNGSRGAQLLRKWSLPLDRLLDLAITHELGHIVCNDTDERRADDYGRALRSGKTSVCFIERPSTSAR